jgi:hypothetical protein
MANRISREDMRVIAKKIIAAFNKHDLPCCLIGSGAVELLGVRKHTIKVIYFEFVFQ